jgi:mRNA interferase YafQ
MLIVKLDKRFKKDIQRDKKSGKFNEDDFNELKQVMTNLIDEIELDKKYLEHKLIGDFKGFKECHLQPNWLLIYKIDGQYIKFARLGTHQQIFKKY